MKIKTHELTWEGLWEEIRVDFQYPVRIYGYLFSGLLFLQAFYQSQLNAIPSWILWANGALAWGGSKLTERKTNSRKYLDDNSD